MIAAAIEQMIAFYQGNLHDINHFLKVWAFARTIGEQEGLDEQTQRTLELAAVVHDIACPACREKYGNANGKYQELEGPAEAKKLLDGLEWPADVTERVCYLVGHHHTYHDMDGMDYQILVEADFLVNLFEDKVSPDGCKNAYHKIFRTESGKRLYQTMYPTA